jgi:hypothetical protein
MSYVNDIQCLCYLTSYTCNVLLQLDVGTKTCIRDALYRLANNVEQRHCVDQNVGSSGAASRQVYLSTSETYL